ncbi:hypothetical protein AB0L88_41795 [Saccharopolyspora shandongensis]|uniref:hypothetical protein n=1 Tax=Saccharopolyspora shandongensis TaxID=418495 RepID=UPI0034298AEA
MTSTSRLVGVGASGASTPLRRTQAVAPSVAKTSPPKGSATAAAPLRSATLTATTLVPTA